MSADFFTKPLPKPHFKKHRINIKLSPHLVSQIKREYYSARNLLEGKRKESGAEPFYAYVDSACRRAETEVYTQFP